MMDSDLLKEIQRELRDNTEEIKHINEEVHNKIDDVAQKLTDVFNIVSHLQSTILFVLASGSLLGAVGIFIAASAMGF